MLILPPLGYYVYSQRLPLKSQQMSQHTNSISATMQESVWYQMLSLLNTPGHNMLLSHCNNLPALPLFIVLRRKQHY